MMTPLTTSAARRGLALAIALTLTTLGCDTETTDPVADGTDATDGTDSTESTDGTDTTDGTDGTGVTDGTDSTDGTDDGVFCEPGSEPDVDGFTVPGAEVASVYCAEGVAAYAALPDGAVLELAPEDTGEGVRMRTRRRNLTDNTTIEVAEVVADGSLAGFTLFPGADLAVAGDWSYFGYTGAGDGFPGSVVAAPTAADGAAPAIVDAPGNFGVAAVDANAVLVTALGVAGSNDGNGLYLLDRSVEPPTATLLAHGLGASSGSVAVQGDLVLVGGFAGFGSTWPDGSEGNRVFAFDLAALMAAPGPVDAWTGSQQLNIPADFDLLAEDLLVTREVDESFLTTSLTLHHLVVGAKGRVFITDSAVLSEGPTFDAAQALPGGDLLLRGPFGYARATPTIAFEDPTCATPCPEYATCVGGDTCAVACDEVYDPASLKTALGDETTLLVDFCGDYGGFSPITPWDERSILALSSGEDAGETAIWLSHLDLVTGDATVAAEHVIDDTAAADVFVGGYLAVGPTSETAWFGYTTSGAGFPGEVLNADPTATDGETMGLGAPGNYDVSPISATEALVNGLGAGPEDGGQGLYLVSASGEAAHVATNLGSSSGSVAVYGDVVIAGGFAGFGTTWPDDSEGDRVFALGLADLQAAAEGAPVDVFATAQELTIGPNFQFLPDGRLLTVDRDETWTITGITVHSWETSDAGDLVVLDSRPVATGSLFTDAAPLPGTDLLLLRHAGGLTLVAD